METQQMRGSGRYPSVMPCFYLYRFFGRASGHIGRVRVTAARFTLFPRASGTVDPPPLSLIPHPTPFLSNHRWRGRGESLTVGRADNPLRGGDPTV